MLWFIEGGPSMYAILGTDVLLLVGGVAMMLVAIAARFVRPLIWPARLLTLLLLLAALLPALEGVVGWYYGMQQVEQAIEHAADDEMREQLRIAGTALARIPLWFGFGSAVVVGLAAWLPIAIAWFPVRDPED